MTLRREALTVLLAAIAGYAGGLVSGWPPRVRAAKGGTIRATRFELVDSSGKVLSYWGFDPVYRGRLVLAFNARKGGELAGYGVDVGGPGSTIDLSFLTLGGWPLRERAGLWATSHGATLTIHDGKWSPRVKLGFCGGSDDSTAPLRDRWCFDIFPSLADMGTRRGPAVSMGYWKDPSGPSWRGWGLVTDSSGKEWKAP